MPTPRWRLRWVILTGCFALIGLGAGIAWLAFPHWTFRIATGPLRSDSQRLMMAFARHVAETHPRTRFRIVPQPDGTASAQALNRGEVELAIVRSDVPASPQMRSLAIVRRDVVALLVPPYAHIETVGGLAKKTIGIVQASAGDEAILDLILNHYRVPLQTVQRLPLALGEVGQVIARKRVAAVVAIGPVGSGLLAEVISAMSKAAKGTPELVPIDAAEVIAQHIPALDDIEMPAGAFGGTPPLPGESVTTLAVTWQLVARATLSTPAAGEIARLLFTSRAHLVQAFPQVNSLEAPDTDPSAAFPVHPGAAAYFDGGHTSMFDQMRERFEGIFYLGAMLLSLLGSAYAWLRKTWRGPGADKDGAHMQRLLAMFHEVPTASSADLVALEQEVHTMVAWSLECVAQEAMAAEQFQVFSQAVIQVRYALAQRREHLHHTPARQAVSEP